IRYPHSRLGNEIPYVLFRKRTLSVSHLRIPGCLAYVHILKANRASKLDSRAWKGVVVGYAMGTKGYRIWDPISNDVYESKHTAGNPIITPVESSDDSDDDSSPNQPQPLTPVRPAPKAPQRRPNVLEIPPYVSSRRKPVPVSTTCLKPTSSKGFNRAPIPNKPGLQNPFRSRPELRDYCEQALKIPYIPDEFNWKPSEPIVDTVSQVDTDGDDVAQTKVQETDIDTDSDPECYTVRANDKVFHARFSREAIAQCCARIEQDRFRRDLAYNSGGSRLLACGQKFRLFHRNSENGFLLIFDRLKHCSLPQLCERTRADHYNVQL
uniref:Retroviral polymerase SH3-like domain-containing protein n=1 Tax=Strigamia maritima TaxID=126957 RepID=T1J732_STRMM